MLEGRVLEELATNRDVQLSGATTSRGGDGALGEATPVCHSSNPRPPSLDRRWRKQMDYGTDATR